MRVPERARAIEAGRRTYRRRSRSDPEWVEDSILWQSGSACSRTSSSTAASRSGRRRSSRCSRAHRRRGVHAHAVRESIIHTLTHRVGWSGDGFATVKGAFTSSDDVRTATGVLGLIFTFFYISRSRPRERACTRRAWRRPPGARRRRTPSGRAWLVGVARGPALHRRAWAAILRGGRKTALLRCSWTRRVDRGSGGSRPWLMLQRQVRWRRMSMPGLLTGVGPCLSTRPRAVWMARSRRMRRSSASSGPPRARHLADGRATIIVVGVCVARSPPRTTGASAGRAWLAWRRRRKGGCRPLRRRPPRSWTRSVCVVMERRQSRTVAACRGDRARVVDRGDAVCVWIDGAGSVATPTA